MYTNHFIVEKKTRNSKEKTINIIKNLEKKKIEVSYRVTAKKITAFKNRFFISRKKKKGANTIKQTQNNPYTVLKPNTKGTYVHTQNNTYIGRSFT